MDELPKVNRSVDPLLPKGDIVAKPDDKHREKGREHHKKERPAEENHDDTFFSLAAIRALLKQENATLDEETRSAFDLLQQRGVTSIPIRDEQPIIDAVKDAAARL